MMGGAPIHDSREAKVTAQPVNTTDRLAKLRKLFKEQADGGLNAYVVPTDDAHGSEYTSDVDKRRDYISGFDGSAGTAVITADKAYLFTDGRYFLQAEKQLDKNWTLMKRGEKDVPTWQEFLAKLPQGSRIGVDPTLINITDAKSIKKALEPVKSSLVQLDQNLVDVVWAKDRPARPAESILIHPIKYAGRSSQDKVVKLREEIKEKKCSGVVISALDDVAWLFNIRGSDIAFNPVAFAYALVTPDKVVLYAQHAAVSSELRTYLAEINVELQPYEEAIASLRHVAKGFKADEKVLLGENASLAVAEAVGLDRAEVVPSLVAAAKAIKNDVELEGFRQCHIRDGAALCAYFAWLEEQLHSGAKVDEAEGASQLEQYRSQLELFRGLSFPAISSAGPNAAVIHYSPTPNDCADIDVDQIYLCDSGGQYSDGTTDVTRTLHFGTPTEAERHAFTLVLKGHIAIDTAIFPKGTTGFQLDILARTALWREGLDYNHGTGHGVGSFLNVHEGPQGIASRIATQKTSLAPGMTVSNEPGYYHDGAFGIRIESIVLVREAYPPHDFGKKGWLRFERVTMTPIQTTLLETSLLTVAEKRWLNDYHAEVYSKVRPLLEKAGDDRALVWLKRECAAI